MNQNLIGVPARSYLLRSQVALHITLVAPVQKLGVTTENLKAGQRLIIFLNSVVKVWG